MHSNNDFKITIPITRAFKGDNGELYIEGVASSTEVDSHETIFNENCQEGFVIDINNAADTEEPVVIEVEHLGDEEPINHLGALSSARVTPDSELYIVARLDDKNPKSVYYWELLSNPDPKLGRPKRLGFSINGYVQDAHWEFSPELNKTIRVFDRVKLRKVGIVRAPSNPSTWVEKLVRSVNWSTVETKEKPMEDVTLDNQDSLVETSEGVENVEVRSEEVVTTEPVERVECYDSFVILEAIEKMISAMSDVEYFIESEKWEARDDQNTLEHKLGVDVLTAMNGAKDKLLSILSLESQPSEAAVEETRDVEGMSHEDLSDDMEQTMEANQEVREEAVVEAEEIVEEVTERTEEVSDEATSDQVLDAVKTLLEDIERSFETKFEEMISKFEGVARKLEDSEKANVELIERMQKIENSPVSTPAAQITGEEFIVRSQTDEASAADKRKEAIERAKASKDIRALIKLQVLNAEV